MLVATQRNTWDDWEAQQARLDAKQRARWQALKAARARGLTLEERTRVAAIDADENDPLCATLRQSRATYAAMWAVEGELARIARGLEELTQWES